MRRTKTWKDKVFRGDFVDKYDCFARQLPEGLPDRRERYGTCIGVCCTMLIHLGWIIFLLYAINEVTQEEFVDYISIQDSDQSRQLENVQFFEHTVPGYFDVNEVIPN